MKKRLVIIGSGMAGGKLAEEVLARSDAWDLTVIGDENVGNYNRIKLLYKLLREDVEEFFLNDESWYKAHRVTPLLGVRAERIDRDAHEVVLAGGQRVPYDACVIATGSRPFVPQIPGLDLGGVGVLRNLDDVAHVTAWLKGKTEVMVVGGGLLGLELALILKSLGKRITVSHLMKSLMETQLAPEAAGYLQKTLEQKGMRFVVGTYITELLGSTEGVHEAVFKDGQRVETEAVLFSTGVRPDTVLAKASALTTNKGIVVNAQLQTSDPDIYAVGECLEFEGKTWGLVAPVYEQARVLASVLAGEQALYVPSDLPPTRLKSDIPVISMGLLNPAEDDEVVLFQDPKSLVYKRLIARQDKLVGATLIGEDLNADAVSLHYTAKIPLPERRADLLFPGAKAGEQVMDASGWPDDLRVCDCVGVSAGTLRGSIAQGNDTLTKLMNATKAGTGCGQCKNKIKAVLIGALGELKEDPSDRWYVPGIPLDREALSAFILENSLKSVSSVLRKTPGAVDDPKTRLGLDYLLSYLWKGNYEVERDGQSANDRYGGNIQKDGRFSVIPHVSAGMIEPSELRALADVADEYKAKLKVTGADRIGIYSIRKEDLQKVWDKLAMKAGHAYSKSFRAAKACVGSTYCRFGLADALSLGARLSDRYRGLTGPAKVKMGVSGCPRNCSEATIKDLGVVAVDGGWDIYIGGNGGAKVVAAQKIARVKTADEVLQIADRFYEFYRKNGRYGERSAPFVERLGLEKVMDGILYDTEANLKKLESDLSEALANVKDPWKGGIDLHDTIRRDNGDPSSQKDWEGNTVLPPDRKIDLGKVEEVPEGENRLFNTPWGDIVVFHGRDGRWAAGESRCPHRGGPMVDCHFISGQLTCPLHSFVFDSKTGSCGNAEVRNLKVWPVEVANGRIAVTL
ncbi:MAG: FAD-dependent oxidoreductase [Spirochaetales bacterium]|nr:FAD-dependent oxidoreductase [Spirochaetales bacterium]